MNKFTVKLVELGRNIRGAWLLLNFMLYLIKIRAFSSANPTMVLRVAQKFVDLSTSTYTDNSFVMGRTLEQSSMLFSALVDKWFRDKSNNALEQILEVFRNEFLGRRNGRQ